MGLDQYAGVREKGDEKILEIAVWRKHPNLQGWMEKRYRLKGGTEEFNCVNLELTSKDIDDLEVAVSGEADSALPQTTGFFFGSTVVFFSNKDIFAMPRCFRILKKGC